MKIIAVLALLLAANSATTALAQEDCDCGYNPYVHFELNKPLELDENPWRVISSQHYDFDLTQEDEQEVCVVQMELIPPDDPILFTDFQKVPQGDFGLLWNGRWALASEFTTQMYASACDITGLLS